MYINYIFFFNLFLILIKKINFYYVENIYENTVVINDL